MGLLINIRPKNESISASFRPGLISTLKRHHYRIEASYSIMGDQPKQFIRVYEYEQDSDRRKHNPRTWPLYIAKTAEKWYPTESITEYLLNQIGECWGMPMAKSRLVWANGQVRFLSLFFLDNRCEELTHGADILAGYFNDRSFIEAIEVEKKEREFIDVQLFERALAFSFGEYHTSLFRDFVKMLLFDALVGNNDRHFWNYGVIRDVRGLKPPRFSPIYDTARGLYWNLSEKELVSSYRDKRWRERMLNGYIRKSQPKMSWQGVSNLNHLQMVTQIAKAEAGLSKTEISAFFNQTKLASCLGLIDRDFTGLLSPERIVMIKDCLTRRLELINGAL